MLISSFFAWTSIKVTSWYIFGVLAINLSLGQIAVAALK